MQNDFKEIKEKMNELQSRNDMINMFETMIPSLQNTLSKLGPLTETMDSLMAKAEQVSSSATASPPEKIEPDAQMKLAYAEEPMYENDDDLSYELALRLFDSQSTPECITVQSRYPMLFVLRDFMGEDAIQFRVLFKEGKYSVHKVLVVKEGEFGDTQWKYVSTEYTKVVSEILNAMHVMYRKQLISL